MWQDYASEMDAVEDALRLARGMTYKYAAAGVNLGGGKAVIIGDPKRTDREPVFRALGKFINRLGGKYITGEDVGDPAGYGIHSHGNRACRHPADLFRRGR
jgi:leucine dehydrogenase